MNDETVELRYGKIGAKFYGPITILALLLLFLSGLVVIGIVRFNDAQATNARQLAESQAISMKQHEDELKKMDTVISKQEAAIGSNLLWQQTTKDGFEVNNYILLQTPEKRAELAKKISMPKSLERKIKGLD